MSQKEIATLRRFLGAPSSLAEWVTWGPDYPQPYRIPADQASLIATYYRLRLAIRDMARLAPWLKPRGVSL
jgi:hypothetical protein